MAPDRACPAPSGTRPDDPVSRAIAEGVDLLMRNVPAARRFRRTLEMATRFAGVGAASSLLYAVAVAAAASGLGVGADLSALLGYGVTIPVNFLMHRHFTFHSVGGVSGDLVRYAFVQGTGVVVSVVAMAITVDALHLPYAVGILAAIVLVPVVTYLFMDRWVFAHKAV